MGIDAFVGRSLKHVAALEGDAERDFPHPRGKRRLSAEAVPRGKRASERLLNDIACCFAAAGHCGERVPKGHVAGHVQLFEGARPRVHHWMRGRIRAQSLSATRRSYSPGSSASRRGSPAALLPTSLLQPFKDGILR
jgi:hypothetical protein